MAGKIQSFAGRFERSEDPGGEKGSQAQAAEEKSESPVLDRAAVHEIAQRAGWEPGKPRSGPVANAVVHASGLSGSGKTSRAGEEASPFRKASGKCPKGSGEDARHALECGVRPASAGAAGRVVPVASASRSESRNGPRDADVRRRPLHGGN